MSLYSLRLLVLLLAIATWPLAADAQTEDEIIEKLTSTDESTVLSALGKLESKFATSPKSQAAIKKMLKDQRAPVRRKAVRALGDIQAEMDASSTKDICAMFAAKDKDEVSDALKALRQLKAPLAVPEILPLLNHPSANVVRDALRTLAVLGNKEIIPAVSVLLQNAEPGVISEARATVKKLRAKP